VQNEEGQMLRVTFPRSRHRETLEAWRSAAELVRDRWLQFKVAEREARPFMFAAYCAALDREEAAAAALARLTVEQAA
jgi:hypothetical protein